MNFGRVTRRVDAGLSYFSKKTEILWLVLPQGLIWFGFFRSSSRTWDATSVVAASASLALIIFMALVIIGHLVYGTMSLRRVVVSAVSVLSLLVASAAITYYSIGTRSNWNMELSHLDALVVSIGTLTTVGTAGISPRSELARGIILGQMVADFVVVTVAVGFVLQRVISPRIERRAEPATDEAGA